MNFREHVSVKYSLKIYIKKFHNNWSGHWEQQHYTVKQRLVMLLQKKAHKCQVLSVIFDALIVIALSLVAYFHLWGYVKVRGH